MQIIERCLNLLGNHLCLDRQDDHHFQVYHLVLEDLDYPECLGDQQVQGGL